MRQAHNHGPLARPRNSTPQATPYAVPTPMARAATASRLTRSIATKAAQQRNTPRSNASSSGDEVTAVLVHRAQPHPVGQQHTQGFNERRAIIVARPQIRTRGAASTQRPSARACFPARCARSRPRARSATAVPPSSSRSAQRVRDSFTPDQRLGCGTASHSATRLDMRFFFKPSKGSVHVLCLLVCVCATSPLCSRVARKVSCLRRLP